MDKKFVIGTIIVTVLILIGSVWAAFNLGQSAEVEPAAGAQVVTSVTSHDWGDIDIQGGKVEATYPVTNEGDTTLKLYNVTTSCACTSAYLELGDKSSPMFGMHSQSSYVMEVPPGETATVRAVFDPLFHGPDAVGEITRQITVMTNDPDHPELTFTAAANVIKSN